MKVGILTYHASHNYGAYLQSYALANVLKQKTSHEVEIINFNTRVSEKTNKAVILYNKRLIGSVLYNIKKYNMFQKCASLLPLTSSKLISDDLEEFRRYVEHKYDIIIVGSDEIWKLDGFRGFPNPYWLPGVKDCIKVSYAASSRNEIGKLSKKTTEQVCDFLQDFSYIGVRDESTKYLLKSILKGEKQVHLNCDPTFAYDFQIDREAGKAILKNKFHVNHNKKIIGLMCGGPDLADEIIRKYSKNDCQIVSLYYYYRNTNSFVILTPFEWINVIAALDGFITTFFHGMVFALKSNTPFIAIEGRDISNPVYSKNYDILKRNGMDDYYVQMNKDKNLVDNNVGKFVDEVVKGSASNDFIDTCKNEAKMFEIFLQYLQELKFKD